jgi:acyl-CoA synthetase (AMP-forming)/AMP-acid ligase II
MFWSGDLAYRDADGWIYFAGRSGDWLRVDGENMTTAPVERILQRLAPVSHVAVYAVPDEHAGDQVMAAIVLTARGPTPDGGVVWTRDGKAASTATRHGTEQPGMRAGSSAFGLM